MSKNYKKVANALSEISDLFKRLNYNDDELSCDISVRDCQIIKLLSTGKKTMSELSEKIHLTPGSMTAHIDSLISKKLVLRENDTYDRRKIYIKLSKKGEEISKIFIDANLKMSKKLLSYLSEDEKENFSSYLDKIARGIKDNK